MFTAVGSKASRKVSTGTPGKKINGKKSMACLTFSLHSSSVGKKQMLTRTFIFTAAGKSHGGGNPYHPRETPEWQKPITSFMNIGSKTTTNNASSVKERIVNI